MRGRFGRSLLVVLAFGACSLSTAASAQSIRTVGRVLATSEVGGRFAQPICIGDAHLRPAPSADFTHALHREAQAEDRPLVIDLGGLIVPHGVARYSAVHQPSTLATMVRDLGYRALTLGEDEIAAPRESVIAVLTSLRRLGVPMIASNLRCTAGASELCDVVVDASDGISMHDVDGRRTAVISLLAPTVLRAVAPDRREGLVLEPVAEALPALVRRAREAGASIVVATYSNGHARGTSAAALALARELDEDARPDVMLLSEAGDELLFARPAGTTPALVGAPVRDTVEVRIRESDELRHGYEMLAQPLGMRGVSAAPPVQAFIDAVGPGFCADWGRPLAGGRLTSEIDPEGFARLVARIVRERTGADVVVLNRDVIDQRWRPARPNGLSASDVFVALEYDEGLYEAEVDDAWLNRVGGRVESHRLVTPGLARQGDAWQVGGHPLVARAGYRVVTIGFLARGGDEALPDLPRDVTWSPVGADETLRAAVLEHLERPEERDVREVLPDPRRTTQWLLRASLDGTFSGTTVENSAGYELGQLNLFEFFSLGLEGNVFLGARDPDWNFENALYFNLRTSWFPGPDDEPGNFIKPADIIRLRSTFAYAGLRSEFDEAYVPDFYAELFGETELISPDPAVRDWHSLYVRPTVGARWRLFPELDIKLAAGLQSQIFDPNSGLEPGVGTVLTLQPFDIARIDDRFIQVEMTADYFISDLGGVNRQQFRATGSAAFDLAGPLKLTFNFNFFMQSDETRDDPGYYLSATAGLRLAGIGRFIP